MNNFNKIKQITIDFLKQFFIIIIYLFIVITLQLIFKKALISSNIFIMNISNLTIELITLTIFILIFRNYLAPDYYDFKKNGHKYLKKYYRYYLIGLVIMIISNIIISSFVTTSTNEELNRFYLKELPIYSILSIVVMAPIIEECLTRIILKDTFKTSFLFYLFSGLIFGSLHLLSASSLNEIFYIIPYGALGFVFAMMYKKSNNIWTNIFFHSLHNFIAIMIIFGGI